MPRHRDTPLPLNPITRQLADLINSAGIAAVAERSGYETSDIKRWLAGRNRMPVEALIDLANTIGYDIYLEPARIPLPNPLKVKPNAQKQ